MKRQFVIIKPDAFNVLVNKETVRGLFMGLSDFISGLDNTHPDYVHLRDSAIALINQRANREPSFRGQLSNDEINSINHRMELFLPYVKDDYVNNIIIFGLEVLGCFITDIKQHTLTNEDVSNIYSLNKHSALARNLHQYLDNQTACIVGVLVSNAFLLQWWKIFVRCFLIQNEKEYLLKNLIHVSENDATYIETIVDVNQQSGL